MYVYFKRVLISYVCVHLCVRKCTSLNVYRYRTHQHQYIKNPKTSQGKRIIEVRLKIQPRKAVGKSNSVLGILSLKPTLNTLKICLMRNTHCVRNENVTCVHVRIVLYIYIVYTCKFVYKTNIHVYI